MANGKVGPPEGNQNAARQQREVTNALRRAVAQNPNKLKKACEKVLDEAQNGNLAAFNVIADRLDGKPIQAVDVKVTELTHEEALDLLCDSINESDSHTTH